MEKIILGGRYALLEKISEGGMSTIYRAYCNVLNRVVAVKILKQEFSNDEEFLKKFNNEAKSAAALNHPNIVGVYDIGSDDDVSYIVMEFVDGKNIKQIINERGSFAEKGALEILRQICVALKAAHDQGIVHRDIKPHNIIIDENLNVKVTDFGIARIATSSTITYTSSVLGTVHYISPEQAKGKFIDEKSDIYSLGVVMYEMVTGRVPFDTDNAVGIAMQHINEPLVEPIKLVPNLEPWLNSIIVKCMEKTPENRFDSASSLIKALDDKHIDNNQKVTFNDNSDRAIYRESVYKTSKAKDSNKPIIRNSNKNREQLNKKKGIFDYSITYVILALLIIASVFFIYRLAVSNKATDNVKVPAVTGLDKDEAIKLLKEKKLNGLIVKTVNDDSVEAGKIVEQSPAANSEVKEGTNVELTVSVGKNKTIVPNLSNIDLDKVEDILSKSNLSLGKVERKYDDKVDENKIISQSVNFGEEVEKGTKIDIVVSRGKEDKKVEVPDLMGKTEAEAIKILYDSGLAVGKTEKKADNQKAGTVIWQSYGKGVKVDAETKIDIVISSGKSNSDSVLNLNYYTEAGAVTKKYTVNEPDKNYQLVITKNSDAGETKIYEKTIVTGGGKLTINIKAKSSDRFNIYINGELILSGEN